MNETQVWLQELDRNGTGNILPTGKNITTILQNDVNLNDLVYNELTGKIDILGKTPWKRVEGNWSSLDFYNLCLYIENEYGIYTPVKLRETLLAYLSSERKYHPIRDYLNSLVWDGIPRMENLFIDSLGAMDTEYVRTVTRKTLIGAVLRAFRPGSKFDNVLVLCGPQGCGKSSLFHMLGREWYSDSLLMMDLKDKTAAEKMQGIWIMELGELAALKKADVETIKSFLSRSDDKYRIPYGQQVDSHPRTGIIVGSTNRMEGFLTDITGNRRFWPVAVSGKGLCPVWEMNMNDIDQIWAESVFYYNAGETPYLERDFLDTVKIIQERSMETDPRQGIVDDFLELYLPESWNTMGMEQRRLYIMQYRECSQKQEGVYQRKRVCILEIWCECFEKNRSDIRKADAYEIESMIIGSGKWELYSGNESGKTRVAGYGVQKTFCRKE